VSDEREPGLGYAGSNYGRVYRKMPDLPDAPFLIRYPLVLGVLGIGVSLVIGAIAYVVIAPPQNNNSVNHHSVTIVRTVTESWAPPLWFWILCGVVIIVTVALLGWYVTSRVKRDRANMKALQGEADFQRTLEEKKLAQLKTVTPLATLLEINQDQIDQYHRIATEQANRSFKSSQRAMALGLTVIVACLAAGIYLPSSEAKLFVGAVAAVGAALSGFLSRTYIHMYGQTLGQLNRYFDQPVLTNYYLTAERLAQDLSDNPEGEMRRLIIQQVLDSSSRLNGHRTSESPGQKRKKRSSGRLSNLAQGNTQPEMPNSTLANGSGAEQI
jgi:hypothetical protein